MSTRCAARFSSGYFAHKCRGGPDYRNPARSSTPRSPNPLLRDASRQLPRGMPATCHHDNRLETCQPACRRKDCPDNCCKTCQPMCRRKDCPGRPLEACQPRAAERIVPAGPARHANQRAAERIVPATAARHVSQRAAERIVPATAARHASPRAAERIVLAGPRGMPTNVSPKRLSRQLPWSGPFRSRRQSRLLAQQSVEHRIGRLFHGPDVRSRAGQTDQPTFVHGPQCAKCPLYDFNERNHTTTRQEFHRRNLILNGGCRIFVNSIIR